MFSKSLNKTPSAFFQQTFPFLLPPQTNIAADELLLNSISCIRIPFVSTLTYIFFMLSLQLSVKDCVIVLPFRSKYPSLFHLHVAGYLSIVEYNKTPSSSIAAQCCVANVVDSCVFLLSQYFPSSSSLLRKAERISPLYVKYSVP